MSIAGIREIDGHRARAEIMAAYAAEVIRRSPGIDTMTLWYACRMRYEHERVHNRDCYDPPQTLRAFRAILYDDPRYYLADGWRLRAP